MPYYRLHAGPTQRTLRKIVIALFIAFAMAWILLGLSLVILASR